MLLLYEPTTLLLLLLYLSLRIKPIRVARAPPNRPAASALCGMARGAFVQMMKISGLFIHQVGSRPISALS